MKTKTVKFNTRQEMANNTFEIFHYKDPRMQEVPIHHHDFYELYLFMGGEVSYRVEGNTYSMKPGDIMLISPSQFHQPVVKPDIPYERIVLWIDKDFPASGLLDVFHKEESHFTPGPVEYSEILGLCNSMMEETETKSLLWEKQTELLLNMLLIKIMRICTSSGNKNSNKENSTLTSKVLEYLADHYTDQINLDELASKFYVSKYYLSHRFSDDVGMGLYQYVVSKRILLAKELMDDGLSPQEACQKSGFAEYANFYRSFRKEYGISPRNYKSGN